MEMIENKRLEAILNEVFLGEARRGHLKWKVSEIARVCKISKSLVYYHLGKTKEEILNSCIEIVGTEFYGLNAQREQMVRQGDLVSSINYTRSMFTRTPAFNSFYVRWRLTDTDIGRKLKDIDDRYQLKLKQLFPHLSADERLALHAIFYGLAMMPSLTPNALKTALKWLPLS